MPVYMVIESRILNEALYDQYIQLVAPIVEHYGGRYLVRGGKVTSVGNKWNPERMIIIKFPAKENITEWLASAEYQKITILRERGADTRALILEGIPE